MYEIYCKIFQAKTVDVKYLNKNNEILLDIKQLIRIIERQKIKLLCLPNPDSPTGTIVSDKDLEIILKVSRKKKNHCSYR